MEVNLLTYFGIAVASGIALGMFLRWLCPRPIKPSLPPRMSHTMPTLRADPTGHDRRVAILKECCPHASEPEFYPLPAYPPSVDQLVGGPQPSPVPAPHPAAHDAQAAQGRSHSPTWASLE